MEIQFQNKKRAIPVSKKGDKFKGRTGVYRNKLIGVRQRPSGRWVAEIKDTTQKIRMWLGTFETAEEAAKAYDEAACLLRGSNTRTNFVTQVSTNSPLASRIRNILASRKTDDINKNGSTKKKVSKSSPSCSSSSSSTSHGEVASISYTEKTIDAQELFDDAYKPDLSSCDEDFEKSWVGNFGNGFDRFPFNQELVDYPKNGENVSGETEISEFDRMKVERQISASLYAMNGVHEYMETRNDFTEAFWDLPPLCSLMFR